MLFRTERPKAILSGRISWNTKQSLPKGFLPGDLKGLLVKDSNGTLILRMMSLIYPFFCLYRSYFLFTRRFFYSP